MTFSPISGAETTAIRPLALVWSKAARADLRRIYRHLLNESRSADVVDNFVTDLQTKMHAIAASGFMGAPRDYVANGLRAVPYRQRCFYFRIHAEELIVVRVLHGRQDLRPEQFKES